MRESRILVVDDDAEMQEMVAWTLQREGWRVEKALTMEVATRRLAQHRPPLMVLDMLLADGNGIDLLSPRRPLYPNMVILMASALGESADRVRGLEQGADDDLAKPFERAELVPRLRALLRRRRQVERQASADFVRRGLRLGRLRREATLNGQRLTLTGAEFKLLEVLLREPGVAVSRAALSAAMRAAIQPGTYRPQDRTVDSQIDRLRAKLQAADLESGWSSTVRGQGYALLSRHLTGSI